jgi:CRP-like cAMP-binding protein
LAKNAVMALTVVKKEAVKKEALLEQWLWPALQRLGTLPDTEWRHLAGQVEVTQLAKGGELSAAGEVADRFALVVSGVIAGWNTIGRRMAEGLVLEREARAHALLTRSAWERYIDFCETHRALLPQLRQGDTASYLGISPVSLSRLKASAGASPLAIAKGKAIARVADTGVIR